MSSAQRLRTFTKVSLFCGRFYSKKTPAFNEMNKTALSKNTVTENVSMDTTGPLIIRSETASPPKIAEATSVIAKANSLPPAYVTSDVPDYMVTRKRIRIYRPTRNAMQSGPNETRYWQIDFDTEDKWENPLMGWNGSGDPVQALRLRFHEKEEAILFAEKQGWDFIVVEDQLPRLKAKSYAENFKFEPGKLKIIKTK